MIEVSSLKGVNIMADQTKSFPMLPIGHWWALRKKFKQSIPGVVTDSYLSTVLDMQANSARANVLPFLKQLGIIDDDGKTGERATLWRDDGSYPEVCKEMVSETYPKELLDAVPNPNQDRQLAERWFAQKTGAGEAAVRRMASLYAVLVEADASKQPDQVKKDRPAQERPAQREKERPKQNPTSAPSQQPHVEHRTPPAPTAPGININLQIHISADATPDQIDQIFASMSKYIYPNRG
jgi:hypothetical protein